MPLRIAALGCGDRHTAAILSSGNLFVWGWNEHGQLGNGGSQGTHTPIMIKVRPSMNPCTHSPHMTRTCSFLAARPCPATRLRKGWHSVILSYVNLSYVARGCSFTPHFLSFRRPLLICVSPVSPSLPAGLTPLPFGRAQTVTNVAVPSHCIFRIRLKFGKRICGIDGGHM